MNKSATVVTLLALLASAPATSAEPKEKNNSVKPNNQADLERFGAKLKAAVKSGTMTKEEALAAWKKRLAGKRGGKMMLGRTKSPALTGKLVYKGKGKDKDGRYTVYVQILTGDDGKSKKGPYVAFVGEQFRKQFEKNRVGDLIEISLGNSAAGTAMKGTFPQKGGAQTFYSIVVGRLKSKDIELGEFTMQVDYVTGIYGDRRLKDVITGKTVKVIGLTGAWLDKLLLIKRGETLKFRSGTIDGTTISLSPKATVLEKAVPFDPKVYPIPPKEFRGFRGVVIGKITAMSQQGYELTLRVEKVGETSNGNTATKPNAIEGRLLAMRGFYNGQYRKKFDALRLGDRIRVGAVHRDTKIDTLDVTGVLEKVAGKPNQKSQSPSR